MSTDIFKPTCYVNTSKICRQHSAEGVQSNLSLDMMKSVNCESSCCCIHVEILIKCRSDSHWGAGCLSVLLSGPRGVPSAPDWAPPVPLCTLLCQSKTARHLGRLSRNLYLSLLSPLSLSLSLFFSFFNLKLLHFFLHSLCVSFIYAHISKLRACFSFVTLPLLFLPHVWLILHDDM